MGATAGVAKEQIVLADWDEWLLFTLEGQQYAVNVLQVREILTGGRLTPVPQAPEFVLGLINLRGSIVTVVDARRRLALPTRPPQESDWTVIIDVNDQAVGILVDQVSEVLAFDSARIEAMRGNEAGEEKRHVKGVVQTDDGMLIVLDIESLVGLKY